MAISLTVDASTCIKCGKCAKVCPSLIFSQQAKTAPIELHNIDNCIVCGHCAAVCPTGSVQHSEFPKEKVHHIDRAALPSPEQMMALIKARRSNRAIGKKPVPEEALKLILEAAHRAPTASNMQQVSFTVVDDPKKLRQIAEITVDTFMGVVKNVKNPILRPIIKLAMPEALKMESRFARLKQELDKGNDPILRGGTAVVFIHTPEKSRFGCQDANLAYQNGSLMAESLGLSQIYTGFVCTAMKMDKKKRIAKMLGIEGAVHAGMSLGVPEFLYPNYIDKKEIEVSRG